MLVMSRGRSASFMRQLITCTRCASEGSKSNLQYVAIPSWRLRNYSTRTQPLRNNTQETINGSANTGDYFGAGTGEPSRTTSTADDEEEFQIKLKILASSLNHVNSKGWSSEALKAGAADLNLSESISGLCTPYDLVEYFQRSSNFQLEKHLKGIEKSEKSLYNSMEYRLKLVTPFIDRYHQAMGLSLEPSNVPRSLQVLRELSDIICIGGLGDKSTDLRWYTKRTGIISLYVATECCMVQDKSENFEETFKFLERRVKDYEFFERSGSAIVPVLESSVTTVLNILGLNRRR